jgi:predicted CXXCH cytochrome family protein
VGSDACQACHEEQAQGIAASAHSQLSQQADPARQGCEACHGPGGNHIASGGDKSTVFSFRDASPLAVRRQCGTCHQVSADTHDPHTMSCLSCHSAHHYRSSKMILREEPPQLCASCHEDKK